MGVDTLPAGTLQLGGEGLKKAIHGFEQAQMADIHNEKLPPTQDGATDYLRDAIAMSQGDLYGSGSQSGSQAGSRPGSRSRIDLTDQPIFKVEDY